MLNYERARLRRWLVRLALASLTVYLVVEVYRSIAAIMARAADYAG